MSRRLTPVFIIGFLLGAQGLSGQELSTSVYPSEDELRQALDLGELECAQYLQLVECALLGVSLQDPHLLDLIPNLSAYLADQEAFATDLETEQSSAFVRPEGHRHHGRFVQSWSRELETSGRERFRRTFIVYPATGWTAEFRLAREYTGRERVIARSLSYRNDRTPLRTLVLGTYSARFGLGTVFGYRGKILDMCKVHSVESWLFPDYGGGNGLLSTFHFGPVETNLAVSTQRDDSHQIVTAALQLSPPEHSLLPSLVLGHNTLRHRSTGQKSRVVTAALTDSWSFGRSRLAAEIAAQTGMTRSLAAVAEGRYRTAAVDLTFSGWAYGDRFLALSGGSKSAALSRPVQIEDVDFECSDRRAGQEGLSLRLAGRLSNRWELINAATVAGFDRTDYRLQWLPALIYRIDSDHSLRLDYQSTLRHRDNDGSDTESHQARARLELRIKSDNCNGRTYIAATNTADSHRYFSWLLQVTMHSADMGKMDAWLTIDRMQQDRIDYWYGYVRHRCRLLAEVELGLKLAHRFSRTAGAAHYTAITLELTAAY